MPGSNHAKPKIQAHGRCLRAWLSILIAALSLNLSPVLANEVRIGYVDMKRLFDSAPQVLAAREALDQEFRPRNEMLMADETRLALLQQTLATSEPGPDRRAELEREAHNLRRSIDRRREDLREELRFRTSTATKALEETIEVAVRQVAEERGYDLILTSPVAYAAPGIDITDRILDWLNEDFASRNNAP